MRSTAQKTHYSTDTFSKGLQMTKNIIAVAIIASLSACSSGGSDSDDEETAPTEQEVTQPGNGEDDDNGTVAGGGGTLTPPDTTVTTPGGGDAPVADSPAGSYLGTVGANSTNDGVFIIDNDNNISGLSLLDDGSAESYFGTLEEGDTVFTGQLQLYAHQESQPDVSVGEFGSVASPETVLSVEVNIVNGQTVENTAESATAVNLTASAGGSVTPATEESLAGSWAGAHGFCGGDECFLLSTELTFNGGQVSGSTVVDNGNEVPISGLITEFGDAALLNFSWGTEGLYNGLVFFNPNGDGRIVFVGELVNGADTAATISGLMTRQ